MSKSFSIDLKQFKLVRHIGIEQKPLERVIGASDLITVLERLGYHNMEQPFTSGGFGHIPGLEELITSCVVGVPTSALVEIRFIGNHNDLLLVTFTY